MSFLRFHTIPSSFKIKMVITKIKPGRFNVTFLESTDHTVSSDGSLQIGLAQLFCVEQWCNGVTVPQPNGSDTPPNAVSL